MFFALASNSTSPFTFTSSITLDNGLLELTALTTLIGSGTAVSLVLGTRGPAGLAWASMSAFGTVGIIRACFAGTTPGWLRETLNLRTGTSDSVVGMELDLGVRWGPRANKVRKHMDRALGVICDARASEGTAREVGRSWKDVYVFDLPTATALSRVPDTKPNAPLRVFTYAKYDFQRRHDTKFHLVIMLLSLSKVIEIYSIWSLGGNYAGFISSIPWVYFFLVALFIEGREIALKRRPETRLGNLDILAGQVPRMGQEGGVKKLVLGAVENPRWSMAWRVIWSTGALISGGTLVLLYFALGQQPKEVVFVWVGFQTLWLLLRILVHHSAEPEDPMLHRSFQSCSHDQLSQEMRQRVVRLTLALSKYQAYSHPRGDYSYKEDCFSEKQISLFQSAVNYPFYPLPTTAQPPATMQVNVMAVVGDTTLSSAAWVMGTKLTPTDVYDCCILLFSVHVSAPNAPRKTFMVPAVRALSGRNIMPPSDPEESNLPQSIPKGSSNLGVRSTWYYWIPCEGGLWLELATEEDTMRILGDHTVQVFSGQQLSARVAAGTLNIGISNTEDIKRILMICQGATESFLELILGYPSILYMIKNMH